jgi:hypothetical protein
MVERVYDQSDSRWLNGWDCSHLSNGSCGRCLIRNLYQISRTFPVSNPVVTCNLLEKTWTLPIFVTEEESRVKELHPVTIDTCFAFQV